LFLDFDDELGLGEDFRRIADDLRAGKLINFRAGKLINFIRTADAAAGIGFDQNVVAVRDEFPHAGRGQADAVFMVFDFFRHTDKHDGYSSVGGCQQCPILTDA